MNADDFEKQLEQQPLRTVPPAWRAEILRAARANLQPLPGPARPVSSQPFSWGESLLRWRWHLAGLSAAWLLIALLNIDHSSAPATLSRTQNPPSTQQLLTALRENRQQLLELMQPSATEAAPWPRTFIPPRRSQLQTTAMA